ncbi:multiple C2 domain and transmembrane region protein 14 [Typha angustifolia]|uniref:multiple C2 domain and transmembrane region protein 14 n=1 Tax=Typha angustifolia TaxID=59011 RepID=UPI003C2BBA04
MGEAVGSRRLVVEVCNARNLMPKDGQGTASAYAIVDFDGQRRRTKTKLRDLNPQWDEKLEFLVHDPESMANEILELNVYNDKKTGKRSTFLGKVKISGSSFAKAGSETLIYYPLEKRSVFSQIKGEIGLKVSFVDEGPPTASAEAAPAAAETKSEEKPVTDEKKPETVEKKPAEEEKKPVAEEKKAEEAKTEDKNKSSAPKEEEKKKSAEKLKTEAAAAKPKEEEEKKKKEADAPSPAPPSPAKDPQQTGYNGDLEIRAPSASERGNGGCSYDLVDRVPYLFVRLLKAKHSGADSEKTTYANLVIGSHSVRTRTVKSGDWDQVFAFHKASLNSTALEVSVYEEKKPDGDKPVPDAALGSVSFDLQEIPKRAAPDSPLAPQWYTLEGPTEGSPGCDVMLAVWVGTQADEAFQEAWQSDSGGLIVHTRSKAYLSPKLWYLRLTVIQTQDLRLPPLSDPKPRPVGSTGSDLYVKAQLGSQVFKTGRVSMGSASSSANPSWNEDLLFVAAEPFDPHLTIVVEDATAGQSVGQAKVPISTVHRRIDDRAEPPSRWLNLAGDEARPYAGRVHVRVCLEGGYHVLDEAVHVASDVRAASKHLSKPPIGLLEVGVRGAANLVPMKVAKDGSSGSTDAYVVLKYGPKWARTRTIIDQFNPRWNEQYAWDVFDPCTVLTIAVFDNARFKQTEPAKDVRIGKVRIRLSTLDTNRVYANSYPLMAVHPVGAKKMGEIELAIRFSCPSWLNLIQAYTSPLLPRMHYVRPLGPAQQDVLRHTAMRTVSARLARSEPPLGPEVVQYLLDTDAHVWSMRRSRANWFRVVGCLSRFAGLARWAHGVRTWAHPSTTVLVHVLLVAVVLCPQLILSTLFLYLFLILVWRYRVRPREPTGPDPRLSHVDAVGSDELDEEFDGFPSSRAADVVRQRYDRLRAVAARAQTLLGDVAAQGERIEGLLSWRDPRATGIFVVFCFLASLVFYAVPIKVLVLGMGFYYLRHPRFRDDMPSASFNFFRRLPSLSDRIL